MIIKKLLIVDRAFPFERRFHFPIRTFFQTFTYKMCGDEFQITILQLWDVYWAYMHARS